MSEICYTLDRTTSLKFLLPLLNRLLCRLSFLRLMKCRSNKAFTCYILSMLWGSTSTNWQWSSQLLECFGGVNRGNLVTKQWMLRWITDATSRLRRGMASPLGVRAYSTRRVGSSRALPRVHLYRMSVLRQAGPFCTFSIISTVLTQIQPQNLMSFWVNLSLVWAQQVSVVIHSLEGRLLP